jgi:ADP-ribose pyrophosphatase YjhB (NUDIX family)
MLTAISCGGVVIHRGKALLLYKNQHGKYKGWVLPKGTVEKDESLKQAALREVNEETGAKGKIMKYLGETQYKFKGQSDFISKTVHWYLMATDSYYYKPQAEEYFLDAGFYKRHEAVHLLKFSDEKQIISKAFNEYDEFTNKCFANKI